MKNQTFEIFENGNMLLPNYSKNFTELPWNQHPTFEGVELKHIITSAETEGQFSYHLVKIAPGKCIGEHIHQTQLETHEVVFGSGRCINNGKELEYKPGTLTIFPKAVQHAVYANEDGLYLFAKFMPALC